VELMGGENHRSAGGGKAGGALRRGGASRDRGGCGLEDDDNDAGGLGGAVGGGGVAFDVPDHNYSSCLTLDALVDGQFAARLDLTRIPCGDITIRVRNYRLEVIVDRRQQVPPRCSARRHYVFRFLSDFKQSSRRHRTASLGPMLLPDWSVQ